MKGILLFFFFFCGGADWGATTVDLSTMPQSRQVPMIIIFYEYVHPIYIFTCRLLPFLLALHFVFFQCIITDLRFGETLLHEARLWGTMPFNYPIFSYVRLSLDSSLAHIRAIVCTYMLGHCSSEEGECTGGMGVIVTSHKISRTENG